MLKILAALLTRAKQGIQSLLNKHQRKVETASNTLTYKALAGTYVLGTAASEAYPVALALGPLAGASVFTSNMLFYGSMYFGPTLVLKYLPTSLKFLKYSTDIFHFYQNPLSTAGRLAGGRLALEGANCVTDNEQVLGAAYFMGRLGGAYASSISQPPIPVSELENKLTMRKATICRNEAFRVFHVQSNDTLSRITFKGDGYEWFFPSLVRCFGGYPHASEDCGSFFLEKGSHNDFTVNFNVKFKLVPNKAGRFDVADCKVLFADNTKIEFRTWQWPWYLPSMTMPPYVALNNPQIQIAAKRELEPCLNKVLPTFIACELNDEKFYPFDITPSFLPNWRKAQERLGKSDSANNPAKCKEGMRLG